MRAVFVVYIASLAAFTMCWYTRLATAVAWLSHFLLIISGFVLAYGVDHFANIFLFYLIWMPAGAAFSLDRKLDRVLGDAAPGVRFSLRVLQFQLCVVYLSSGIYKAQGIQWWNGEAIWRAVTLPMFGRIDMTWLASAPWLAMLLGWGTLAIELGYAFLIWPRVTRRFWILAVVSMHLGIALCLGLISFGLEMAILTAAVFGVSAETIDFSA